MTRVSSPLQPTVEIWRNWPESEPGGPTMKYLPTSVAELVDVTKGATAERRLRASGTRWSSSGAAKADHVWIDTSALNRILSLDLGHLADEASAGTVGNLVLVQAGIKVHKLATELWSRGLSLKTLGGSMGQSIAGAISTGTHGSDIDLPPIAGMVRAIHLVTDGGHEYWLEHPNHPVASVHSLCEHYADWDESIRVRRDADAFNAALVSAGRCGVIYVYVLEAEPAYQLRAESGRSSWTAVKAHLKAAATSGDWRGYMRSRALPFNESTTVRSGGTPAPIIANGRLSLVWGGTRNPGFFRWIHDSSSGWSRKRIIDDGRCRWSNRPPAVAFFKNRYYLAWTGTNANHPYVHLIRSTDSTGAYWEGHIKFDGSHPDHPEAKSSEAPVLLAANEKLHIVWVGTNKPGNFRWITSTDGVRWGDKRILTDPERTRESNHRPAIAFHGGRYYLAWTGTNAAHPYVHLIRSTSSSGASWGGHIKFEGTSPHIPEAKSRDAPQLLAANGKLHIVWVGTNSPGKFRWITSLDGSVWGDKRTLADGANNRASNNAPAIVFHDGHYYLFWRGVGSDDVYSIRSSSATGTGWGSYDKLDVPPGPAVDLSAMRGLSVALSPFGADGNAWWTITSKVGLEQTPTRPGGPPMRAAEQKHLIQALAKALDPHHNIPAGTAAGFLTGLALGGPIGWIVGGIAGAITAGTVAQSSDVFMAITDLVFNQQLNTPDTTGPSFEVTSGSAQGYTGGYEEKYSEFWTDNVRVQYNEVFFDAQKSVYLDYIDTALAYFRSSGAKHAGYVAIRFTGPSSASLAMQRWPVTVAVEVVLVQDLDPAALDRIRAVNEFARPHDVRFHLGMTRPMDYRSAGLDADLAAWKRGAEKLGIVEGDGFSSAFSRAAGLEPERRSRDHMLLWGACT